MRRRDPRGPAVTVAERDLLLLLADEVGAMMESRAAKCAADGGDHSLRLSEMLMDGARVVAGKAHVVKTAAGGY